MMSDDRLKPRFEPPPWEIEAFERFHREQEEICATEGLDRTLETVRRMDGEARSTVAPEDAALEQQEAVAEVVGAPLVSEERIEAMLAELRIEEMPPARAGLTLVYSAVAFLGTTGVFIAIAGIVLFAKSGPAGGSATLIAAMTSIVMLLTGIGCIAAAITLYRRNHQ